LKGDFNKHHIAILVTHLSSGMAFEGLNHAQELLMPIYLVILNDNAIGIDPSVALKQYLTAVKEGKPKNNMIKSLNFDYWDLLTVMMFC
jgi:1-deoxy-D-xylulose-5-phosphate synthase